MWVGRARALQDPALGLVDRRAASLRIAVMVVTSVVMMVMVVLSASVVARGAVAASAAAGTAGAGNARTASDCGAAGGRGATGGRGRIRGVEAVGIGQGTDDYIRASGDGGARRNDDGSLNTDDLSNNDGRKETLDKHSC